MAPKETSNIIPFNAPTKTNVLTGWPINKNIAVEIRMKTMMMGRWFANILGWKELTNETEVYAEPITEVMAEPT